MLPRNESNGMRDRERIHGGFDNVPLFVSTVCWVAFKIFCQISPEVSSCPIGTSARQRFGLG